MKFLKQATYIKYVLAELSKFVQIAHWPPQIPFCMDFLRIKKGLELVFRSFFIVILHKLAKFRYQTVFTS